jgi:hypothetical protein
MAIMLLAAVIACSYLNRVIMKYAPATDSENDRMQEEDQYIAPDAESLTYYGLGDFQTTLPVIYINTQGNYVNKAERVRASMAVLNADPSGKAKSVLDKPDYSEAIMIKYRGASSYNFDKRQYRFEFVRSQTSKKTKEREFLGMGENSDWVLNGPFLDKTLLRNWVAYHLGKDIFEWSPDCHFTELFLDGNYKGVYLAVEPVTNGESRLRLCKFGLLSGQTAYIISRERTDSQDDPLDNYGTLYGKTNNQVFIDYPSRKDLTDTEKKWITKDISKFEKALYTRLPESDSYKDYIDVQNFADYYVFNQIFMNSDMGSLSTYAYKELGGKLKLTIWDYNNCLNNYQWDVEDLDDYYGGEGTWFAGLLQDRLFVDTVVKRYHVLRKTTLSDENFCRMVMQAQKMLGDAKDRNFKVWGYTFNENLLIGDDRDIENYDEAIAQLLTAYEQRTAYLDAHISDLYQKCAEESR